MDFDSYYYNDKFDINWADESNSETLTLEKLQSDNYTLIQVNIEDVFNQMNESYALNIHSDDGGKNAIGNRLENAKNHFMEGNPMDYPIVEYDSLYDETTFTNGRHRTLAAAHMGCKFIPMLVHNNNLDAFKSNIRTKGMDQPLEQARYIDEPDKLKLNWSNENKATDSHTLLQVNLERAFAEMDYDTEEDLYYKAGRDPELSEKIEGIKEKILNKESIDFPSIASNIQRDDVGLTSGKEIALAAYDLGCKFIPMLVSNTDISHFRSIVETKEMNQRLDSIELDNKPNSQKRNKLSI